MQPEYKSLAAAFTTAVLFITTTALSLAESQSIPMDQLGAVATKQVEGDSLSVIATAEGARLRCAFQKLEGEATPEGLWLTSTVTNALTDRFRVRAVAVLRDQEGGGRASSRALTSSAFHTSLGSRGRSPSRWSAG